MTTLSKQAHRPTGQPESPRLKRPESRETPSVRKSRAVTRRPREQALRDPLFDALREELGL
jgi:hypothetical protein